MHVSDRNLLAVLIRQIRGEYLEMPGLRLTAAQGRRLWGLEAPACIEALDSLVASGFLRRTEAGQYVRLTDGAIAAPPLRMAQASPSPTRTSRKAS